MSRHSHGRRSTTLTTTAGSSLVVATAAAGLGLALALVLVAMMPMGAQGYRMLSHGISSSSSPLLMHQRHLYTTATGSPSPSSSSSSFSSVYSRFLSSSSRIEAKAGTTSSGGNSRSSSISASGIAGTSTSGTSSRPTTTAAGTIITPPTHADDSVASSKYHSPCRIKVVGVGGGGGNAINRMCSSPSLMPGVDMWAVNTDAQALAKNLAPNKLNIGKVLSRGLGAGGDPAIGLRAAEESRSEIAALTQHSDLVFVTAGMGGGTGSGAAPVVAECAREAGAVVVGVVTRPFAFEGRKRMTLAHEAIMNLKSKVDTLIVVSNDRLLHIMPENAPLLDAFTVADDVLRQGVFGICDIILKPGLINVDFADVKTIMSGAGTALIGVGSGRGANRATDAALSAITSPLLDYPISRARGVVFNVVGGPDMTLQEVNAAASVIYESVDASANIIFGATIDDSITSGEVYITLLATGFSTDYFISGEESPRAHSSSSSSSVSSSSASTSGISISTSSGKAPSSKPKTAASGAPTTATATTSTSSSSSTVGNYLAGAWDRLLASVGWMRRRRGY